MADVHLYYAQGACSLAPHILLHETSLPFTVTALSVKSGFPSEFEHINPKKRVPVLVINGQTITENPAVMLVISQLVPEKSLMGRTDVDQVRVLEWMNWVSGTLHGQAFAMVLRPARFSDDETLYPAIKEKGLKTVKDCFEQIEAWLGKIGNESGGVFTLGNGESFTAVDGYLYVFYRWGMGMKMGMQGLYPCYTRLARALEGRESVRKALAAEGLEKVVVTGEVRL